MNTGITLLAEVASGRIEIVFNGLFNALQFNSDCSDALPYCNAACCRYIGVPIEAPTCARDWDDWRWYLAHEGSTIYKDSGQWYLNVETRCGHLTPELTCAIYETRPETCAEYDPSACEWQDPDGVWEIHLGTPEELEAFLRKKKDRRNAQSRKRRAAAARKPSRNGRGRRR